MFIYSSIFLLFTFFPQNILQPEWNQDRDDLVGVWEVTFDNGDTEDPSYTTLHIKKISNNTFEGTFYYSDMGECRLVKRNEAIYLAFITEDNSGYYGTVAKWDGKTMEGTTHSIGRDFLAVWTAVKQK